MVVYASKVKRAADVQLKSGDRLSLRKIDVVIIKNIGVKIRDIADTLGM